MIEKFKIAKYEVVFEAGDEGLDLPPYKGSTLRGGFGNVFKRNCCFQKETECERCILKNNCPYSYIFETSPGENADRLRVYRQIPRPFVIEPPIEEKTSYGPGELLSFNLVLMGKAIGYLPYFIVTLRELGDIGLGKGRKKCILREIYGVNEFQDKREMIYSKDQKYVLNKDISITGTDVLDWCHGRNISELTLHFHTMTRMQYEHHFVDIPEFHIIIRNLLRRISTLYYFHQDENLNVDYGQLIHEAEEVKLVQNHTRWVDWERYSSRQDEKMKMGGIVGQALYEGDITPFLPFLKLGELIHVGKQTIFGLGKYEIKA